MKVGFIVECGPDGAETKVIPHLAKSIDPTLDIVTPVTLDDKDKLRRECGQWAKDLLDQGCDRVLIVWDLLPDWGEYEGAGCRHNDKNQIADSLEAAGLRPDDPRIRLVCIEKMLEAWIMADERALSAFLSSAAHPVRIKRFKNPESAKDPKSALVTLFRQSGYRRYIDYDHAIRIVRRIPDLARLRTTSTFCRFEQKLQ
ncbi:MAG: DUF4276 family protein [bacterium]